MFESGKEDVYVSPDDKMKFLDRIIVTNEEIDRIALYEQRTSMWFHERRFRVTGSNFGSVMGMNPYSTPDNVIHDMLWPGEFKGNTATQYGTDREPIIHNMVECHLTERQRLENSSTHVWVQPVGLIINRKYPYLGCSPDDAILIYDQRTRHLNIGLAEYKAPYGHKKQFYERCPPQYYCQFQGQMAIGHDYLIRRFFPKNSGYTLAENACHWTKFCVFSPEATQINDYNFDPIFWKQMLDTLKTFYYDQLIKRFLWKERGLLRDGEIEIEQLVKIRLPAMLT